jgi:PKD repeat protein
MATLTDTSKGNPTASAWDFCDGSVATIQHPIHSYAKAGIYTITLTVRNANGSSKIGKKNCIRVRT